MTTTTDPHTELPLPAGAVEVYDWDDFQTPTPFRYFVGSSRVVDRPGHGEDIEIRIDGTQHHDGSVTRDIVVHQLHADEPITIKQARRLAAALTELVDEAETMAGYDEIT
jgi:hypothetical protein